MIVTANKTLRIILINFKERKAGSMQKDGKEINWNDAIQIVGLGFEDVNGQAKKYIVDPSHVNEITKLLEPVHWGCVLELTLENKQVTAVNVISDVMAHLYTDEAYDL